jgi:hypothetical protein
MAKSRVLEALKGRIVKAPDIDLIIEVGDELEAHRIASRGLTFRLSGGLLILVEGRWIYVMLRGDDDERQPTRGAP